MPKTNENKGKTLTVSPDTHQRVLKRKFKMQLESETEVTIDEVISDLIDQTEPKRKKSVS
jgi:hypothetical protein